MSDNQKGVCGVCGSSNWRGLRDAKSGVTAYACECGHSWERADSDPSEIDRLRSSLSAAEKERDTLKAEVESQQEHLQRFYKGTVKTVLDAISIEAYGARLTKAAYNTLLAERDTALRERDELRQEVEALKVDSECHRIQAVDRGNSFKKLVGELRAALNCPSLPIEELAVKVGEVVEAAKDVLTHVEGSLPYRGWLRDNDRSRAALGRLATSIHPKEGETP